MAKSASDAAAANKATAASAASSDAKQAMSIGEANTAAIDKLNAKIDQMFRKRPAESSRALADELSQTGSAGIICR